MLAFTSKDRPLVIADPGYEAPMWAAQSNGAPILKVPLCDPKGAAMHDIKAMLAAASNPGVIYICNPNNPTGTCTPRKDIEYAVAHAPKDTVLLIDEAYIHLCDEPRSLDFVNEGKNVIVLRTFSKLYGMAGIRMGFAIGRPDLLKKISAFGGMNALPVTAVAAAKASLLDPDLVPTRKKKIAAIRAENIAWLKSQGYAVTPSESNCFMLDVQRPGAEVQAALAKKDMYVGRIWPAWPNSAAHHRRHPRRDAGIPEGLHRSDVELDRRPGCAQTPRPPGGDAVYAYVVKTVVSDRWSVISPPDSFGRAFPCPAELPALEVASREQVHRMAISE